MDLKRLTLVILLSSSLGSYAMEENNYDFSQIEGASYYIIEGNEKSIPLGGIPGSAKYTIFYDADGNVLKKVNKEECDFFQLSRKLDPNAPKPKASTYAIKYWPAISIGFGLKKGSPGYFMVISDKNGNHLRSFRYNEKTKKITISYTPMWEIDSIDELKDVDVQDCVESGSDEIADHSGKQGLCLLQ